MGSDTASIARPTFSELNEDQLIMLVKEIKQLETLFQQEFGVKLYLTWGSLLGVIRNNSFIPHDTDVDLAYLSNATSDFEIVEEHELIIRVLQQLGFPIQRNSKGQIHIDVNPDPADKLGVYILDIWTTFTRDGAYYHYPDVKGEIPEHEICPLRRVSFRDEDFWVPASPQALLSHFYGTDWQIPDAGYAWYPRYSSTDVFEFLRAEILTLDLPDYPKRKDTINIREEDEHFYLSSSDMDEEQRLNASAMLILELCTGTNSVADIILLLQSTFKLPSAPEVVVIDFLRYAISRDLLDS